MLFSLADFVFMHFAKSKLDFADHKSKLLIIASDELPIFFFFFFY